jgi:uncharacterized protein YdhG (YjbR/CyaY superfamily)
MSEEPKTGPKSPGAASAARGRRAASASFSDVERAAMKERLEELRAGESDGERALLAKIAEMPERDRAMAERIHALVTAAAPTLSPRTFYGMPAYARNGKVVCFFQAASKFKSRYATLGFTDAAALDDGAIWPVTFAIQELTPEVEERIVALVKKAVG